MKADVSRRAVTGLATGLVAAGAILARVPMAGAEPDQGCSQQQQPSPQSDDQQQCQQQGPGLPQLPNNNGQNNTQNNGQQNGQQTGQNNQGNRLSDFNCWMYPTGPVWPPLGAAPPPQLPGEAPAAPCYYVLGLQPTVPGQ